MSWIASPLGDLHECGFAGLQVPDPRVEVDDLAGHVGGLGLLGDDLRGVAVQAAQRIERILPAVDRDAVGDLGVRLVVNARGLRGPDVTTHSADRVARFADRAGDVADLQVHRPGPDDLRVVDRADLGSIRAGRGSRLLWCLLAGALAFPGSNPMEAVSVVGRGAGRAGRRCRASGASCAGGDGDRHEEQDQHDRNRPIGSSDGAHVGVLHVSRRPAAAAATPRRWACVAGS